MIQESNYISESNRAIEYLQERAYKRDMSDRAARRAVEWGIKKGLLHKPMNYQPSDENEMPAHADGDRMAKAFNAPSSEKIAHDMALVETYLRHHPGRIQAKEFPQVRNGLWSSHQVGALLGRMIRLGLPITKYATDEGGYYYEWEGAKE